MLAVIFCYSQKCDLEFEGQILDLHDNSPIGQATIKVVNSDQTVFSDDEGFFRLKNLCSGEILIKISHLKCKDLFQEVNLKKSVFRKFYIEHHIESLSEVIVEGSRIRELSSSAKTYLLSDLQKDKEKNGIHDFMRILEVMPEDFAMIEMGVDDICRSGLVRNYLIAKNAIGI